MGPENLFDEYFTFSSNSQELLNSFPNQLLEVCYTQYIRDFGRFASKVHLQVPWFVPKDYGGAGLASFGKRCPTPLDRATCSLIHRQNVKVASCKKETIWKFHERVEELIEDDLYHHEDGGEYDSWYAYATKVCFQRAISNDDSNSIFSDLGASRVIGALRRNEKMWKKFTNLAKKSDSFDYSFCLEIEKPEKPVFLPSLEEPCLF